MLQYKIMRKIAFLAVDLGELKIANYYCEKINQIDKHDQLCQYVVFHNHYDGTEVKYEDAYIVALFDSMQAIQLITNVFGVDPYNYRFHETYKNKSVPRMFNHMANKMYKYGDYYCRQDYDNCKKWSKRCDKCHYKGHW